LEISFLFDSCPKTVMVHQGTATMMSAPRLPFVLFIVAVLLVPLGLSSHGSGDIGANDAGNSRVTATPITNGNYLASVGAADSADWYSFHISSTSGDSGLPLIDIQVRSQGGWGPGVALFGPGDTDDREPLMTGRGSAGLRLLRTSADEEGTWLMRITGIGHYELRFNVGPENDAGRGRDAPDNTDDAIDLPAGSLNGETFLEGSLTQNDPGDAYRFHADGRVLVALYRAPNSGHGLELIGPGETIINPMGHNSDDDLVTAYLDGGNDDWRIHVTNPDGIEGPYRLALRLNAPTDSDADGGSDAPNPSTVDLQTGYELRPGLRVAKLSTGSPSDLGDAYQIKNVRAGDILRLGLSSHTGDPLRLQITATLYDTQKRAIQTLDPCQSAASIVRTANQTGTWYLRVREATNAGRCDVLPTEGGPYSMALEIQKQNENGDQDAPPVLQGAGNPTLDATLAGWIDDVDTTDTYRVGALNKGQTVRVTYQSMTEGLAVEARLLDDNSNVVASSRTSGGGTRLEATAARGAVHYVQFARYVDDDNPPTVGAYRFDIISLPNQPPLVVSLSDPSDADVGRNTVALKWTRNDDPDFAKYEIHAGASGDFVPNQGTLRVTISNRTLTSHTVTGLEAGRTYTFLIRVVDDAGLFGDSNRRTETTDNLIVLNTAPTLADGRVSPNSGGPSTAFTFSVKYTDADNDTPTQRRLYIDGGPVGMNTSDTKYTDGSVFTYTTTLAPGIHSFFFEFNDGTQGARNPASGTHSGPEVTRDDNRPPTVKANATPSSGDAPLRVQFGATASDPESGGLTYAWDFDNSNGFTTESTARQPTHTYTEAKTYTATVAVTDDRGATSTDSVTIVVTAAGRNAPTADPSASPASGEAPLPVQFRANAADDGRIASYSWDFDNADGIQSQSSAENPTFIYQRGASYVATVTVTDDTGQTARGSVTVIVRQGGNGPPSLRIGAEPTEGDAPLSVAFRATVSDPEDEAVEVSWDFDLANGVQVETKGLEVDHVFTQAGTFTVLATARDPSGATATDSTTITVVEGGNGTAGPIRIVAEPKEGRAPLGVQFRAETNDTSIQLVDYSWDFGDGSTLETSSAPNHTYDRSGRFTVVLRATDSEGTAYTAVTDVVVSGKPQGSPAAGGVFVVLALLVAGVLLRRRAPPDRF
jgi:PKD repeat protein